VQRSLTCGPREWLAGQTPWPTDPTLQPLVSWLHGHALLEAVIRNPKVEVSGSQTRLPPGHVARSAVQHLACYRLHQVSNSSLDPYKYPLPVEFNTPHSTYSSPLVNVPV
jgi:hypothetical protein